MPAKKIASKNKLAESRDVQIRANAKKIPWPDINSDELKRIELN